MIPYAIFIAVRPSQHHATEQKLYLLLISDLSLVFSFVAVSERTPIPQAPFDAERGTCMVRSPHGRGRRMDQHSHRTVRHMQLCFRLRLLCQLGRNLSHLWHTCLLFGWPDCVFYLWHAAGALVERRHRVESNTYTWLSPSGDRRIRAAIFTETREPKSSGTGATAALIEPMKPGKSSTAPQPEISSQLAMPVASS